MSSEVVPLILDYQSQNLENNFRLFPDEINASHWILFHGTTNASEASIESNGFEWVDAVYTRDDVKVIVDTFKTMDWAGLGSDSYLSLSAYALRIDFAVETKPVFFSTTAESTYGYTRKHRVRGETANCILYALRNLQEFFDNDNLQRKYREMRYKRVLSSLRGVDLPDEFLKIDPEQANAIDCKALANYLDSLAGRKVVYADLSGPGDLDQEYNPWDEDLDWLLEKIEYFSPLQSKLELAESLYEYGVVYAVEFSHDDARFMNDFNNGMNHGIAYYGNLSPDRIVAKAIISPNQRRFFSSGFNIDKLTAKKDGIIGCLSSDDR